MSDAEECSVDSASLDAIFLSGFLCVSNGNDSASSDALSQVSAAGQVLNKLESDTPSSQNLDDALLLNESSVDSLAVETDFDRKAPASQVLAQAYDVPLEAVLGRFQREAVAHLRQLDILRPTSRRAALIGHDARYGVRLFSSTLAVDAQAVLRCGSNWLARSSLTLLALTFPCKRLCLWLDVVFAYIQEPSIYCMLSEDQQLMERRFSALPEWARSVVGLAGVLRLLRPDVVEGETREVLQGIYSSVRHRLVVPVVAQQLSLLDGWLQQLGPVLSASGSTSQYMALRKVRLLDPAMELIEDATRLMLGLGPSYSGRTRDILNMCLSLSGLARMQQPQQPLQAWTYFRSKEEWGAYKSSLRWLNSVREACLHCLFAAASRELAQLKAGGGLLKSVLAYAVQKNTDDPSRPDRSWYDWRTSTLSVSTGLGPPELRLHKTRARPQGVSPRDSFSTPFQVPYGSRGKMVGEAWRLERIDTADVYGYGIWLSAMLLCSLAGNSVTGFRKLTIEELTVQDDLSEDNVMATNESQDVDIIKRWFAVDSARLFWFLARKGDSSETPSVNTRALTSWRSLATMAYQWQSYDVVIFVSSFAEKNRSLQRIRNEALIFKNTASTENPSRDLIHLTALHQPNGLPIVVAVAEKSRIDDLVFVSPQGLETAHNEPSCAPEATTRSSRFGKKRALYPSCDGLAYNVERLVLDVLLRNKDARNLVFKAMDTKGCQYLDLRDYRMDKAYMTSVFQLAQPLLPRFSDGQRLLLRLPKSSSTSFYCDENIFVSASHDGFRAVHSENQLLPMFLFCLTQQHRCAGMWKHPFASSSVEDICLDGLDATLTNLLDAMESWSPCELTAHALESYRRFYGAHSPRLRWDLVDESLISDFIHSFGSRQVVALCRRLAWDPDTNFAGMPDVVLLQSSQCSGYCSVGLGCFLEVKSHTDTLKAHQVEWMRYMLSHGVRAGVFSFRD